MGCAVWQWKLGRTDTALCALSMLSWLWMQPQKAEQRSTDCLNHPAHTRLTSSSSAVFLSTQLPIKSSCFLCISYEHGDNVTRDGLLCTAVQYCLRWSWHTAAQSCWSYWDAGTVHRQKAWCENRPSYGVLLYEHTTRVITDKSTRPVAHKNEW